MDLGLYGKDNKKMCNFEAYPIKLHLFFYFFGLDESNRSLRS